MLNGAANGVYSFLFLVTSLQFGIVPASPFVSQRGLCVLVLKYYIVIRLAKFTAPIPNSLLNRKS
jgi:hypothetical protein